MTISVANTANTNTFAYLIARVNELASAMSSKTVTVDSNTATGNALVSGYLFGSGLAANTLRGGNTTVTTVLTVSSNVNIDGVNYLYVGNSTSNVVANSTSLTIAGIVTANSTRLSVGSNVYINTSALFVGNSSVNLAANSSSLYISGLKVTPDAVNFETTGTSGQIVDSFDISTYRGAEYLISVKNNAANGHQLSKILILYDGGDGLITEYGILTSNGYLGAFSANANSTHCRLVITPTVSNTQIKAIRNNIGV